MSSLSSRKTAAVAARKVAAAITERQERIAEIQDAAQRNKRRIRETQNDIDDEKRGPSWRARVDRNEDRLSGLREDLRGDRQKARRP